MDMRTRRSGCRSRMSFVIFFLFGAIGEGVLGEGERGTACCRWADNAVTVRGMMGVRQQRIRGGWKARGLGPENGRIRHKSRLGELGHK